MPPNPLTTFEIKIFYETEQNFNTVYLRNCLPK